MDKLTGVLAVAFMAFVVERLVQFLAGAFGFDGKKLLGVAVAVWVAIVLSAVVAVGADFNFFALFEIAFRWAWFGYLVTALLMSGGSNLWHEIMAGAESAKLKKQAEAAIAMNKAPELAEVVKDFKVRRA